MVKLTSISDWAIRPVQVSATVGASVVTYPSASASTLHILPCLSCPPSAMAKEPPSLMIKLFPGPQAIVCPGLTVKVCPSFMVILPLSTPPILL